MKTYSHFTEEPITTFSRQKPTFADKQKYNFLKMPYACKVCEKAPGESTEVVLQAFSLLPQYKLVVVADWSCTSKAWDIYNRYSNIANIILLHKPAVKKDIRLIIENCFVYIQGTYGNGIAAITCAMLAGITVIACNDEGNRNITGNSAFYFTNSEHLKKVILEKNIINFKETGKLMYICAQKILQDRE